MKRSLKYFLSFLLIAFLWTSCSDDQLFQGNARIKTTFRLKSPTAMGGSVTIREAYLKLNSLGVTGTLGDQNVPPATYPVAADEPPYKLTQADSAQVTLTLPSHAYDLMDLHLLLFESKYQLLSLHQPAEPAPQPATGNTGNNGGTSGEGGTSGGGDSGGNGATDDGQGNGGGTLGGNDDTGGQSSDNGGNAGDNNNDDDGGGDSTDNGADPKAEDNEGEGDKDDKDDKKDDDKEDKDDKGDKDNKGNGEDKDDDKGDDKQNDDDKDDDKEDDDKEDGRARGQVDGTVDLDDFFQNAKPSLVVFATWNTNGENINIVFAVTDVERITIRATQNGDHRVMLADHGTASVTFDPEQWFQSISTADLQNASRQTYQGQPVVFIHHDHNTALFNILYSSLVESATFDFSLPAVE